MSNLESLRASLERLQRGFNLNLLKNTPEYRQNFFNRRIKWPLQYPTQQQIIDAGFSFTSDKLSNPKRTHCLTCELNVIDWDKSDDSYETHLRLSPDCVWLKEHHEELMKARKHACRRCPATFASNTKLHQHVQEHHAKKPEKQSEKTLTDAPKSLSFSSFSTVANPSTVSPPTSSAPKLSFSAISSVETTPTKPTTSILSLFIISCVETTPIEPTTSTKSASVATSPSTSSATSNTSLLWAAIVAKSMPPTSSPTPSSITPSKSLALLHTRPQNHVKSYLTIDDLHRMFAEKPRRTCLSTIQKSTSSPSSPSSFVSHSRRKSTAKSTTQMRKTSTQMRITSYFKSARDMFEKTIFSPLKCDLISRPSHREMRANKALKCALNSTAQRYVSGSALKYVNKPPKMFLSPHISLFSTSLYCRLKTSSLRLRCMSN